MRILFGLAGVAAMVGCRQPRELRYERMTALQDGSVLVVAHFLWERTSIFKIAIDGEAVWEAKLAGRDLSAELLANDHVVSIREGRSNEAGLAIEAFDLRSGHHVWRANFDGVRPWASDLRIRSRESFVEFMNEPSDMIVLDSRTGDLQSQSSLKKPFQWAILDDRAVFDFRAGVVTFDSSGHKATSASGLGGLGCLVNDGRYIKFNWAEHSLAIAERGDLANTHHVTLDFKLDNNYVHESCFAHRERIALVFRSDFHGETRIVIVDRRGHALKQLAVPGRPRWQSAQIAEPATRYVPFISEIGFDGEMRWSMLDLERHALEWTHELPPGKQLFQVGSTWYLVDQHVANPTIVAIDGDTGRVRAAIRAQDILPIKPEHVRGGSFWLMKHPGDWSTRGHVARLDAATLVVTLPSPEIVIEDAQDSAWLHQTP